MEPHKKACQEIDNHRINLINVVDILSLRNLEFKPCIRYTWFFENRVSKDKGSFYYLAIKSNKIRPKADKKPISDAEQ